MNLDRFAIRLDKAWFCESCHVITNDMLCCCCDSSAHTHRLSDWLGREETRIRIPTTGIRLFVVPSHKSA